MRSFKDGDEDRRRAVARAGVSGGAGSRRGPRARSTASSRRADTSRRATGGAPDANAILVPKDDADAAMDAAACIGCGACVAACPNASASLFTAAKIAHLGLLPQGQPERSTRVLRMVAQMDLEGFGNCTNLRRVPGGVPEGDQHRRHRADEPRFPARVAARGRGAAARRGRLAMPSSSDAVARLLHGRKLDDTRRSAVTGADPAGRAALRRPIDRTHRARASIRDVVARRADLGRGGPRRRRRRARYARHCRSRRPRRGRASADAARRAGHARAGLRGARAPRCGCRSPASCWSLILLAVMFF